MPRKEQEGPLKRLLVVGLNSVQVQNVVACLEGWEIPAAGGIGFAGMSCLIKLHPGATHVVLLHGADVMQRFEATVMPIGERRITSMQPLLDLEGVIEECSKSAVATWPVAA